MSLIFPKLKKTVWFFSAFGITMLFCSLIMKHYFENYVTVIAAACISFITIPVHTYKKRKGNFRIIREYRSFKYEKNDTAVEKFKKGLARTHFKAEVIVSALWCILGAFAFSYYYSKRDGAENVALISVLCAIGAFILILLIDFALWIAAISYYDYLSAKAKASTPKNNQFI